MVRKILLLFFFQFSFSQSENKIKIDSLLSVLKISKEDTSKVIIYHKICDKYYQHDIKKLTFYNEKLGVLAKKINYEKGIGLYYYNGILINNVMSEDPIPNALKASAIFFKVKDAENYLWCQYYLAFGYMIKDKHKESKVLINKTLKIALKNNKHKVTGNLYSLMGLIYYYEESLHFALKNYKKALFYYEKIETSETIKSDIYIKMAFIFTDMEQYKESLRYLNLAAKNGVTFGINIEKAIVYNNLNLFEEAKKVLLENKNITLGKSKDIDDYNTFTLSETYYNLKKYNLAISNLEKIIPENKVAIIKNTEVKIAHLNLLANCYVKLNNLIKAEKYNNEALFLIDSAGYEYSKYEVFLSKSKIDEKLRNYSSALSYYKKYADIKEERNKNSNNLRVKELQIDFDVSEKNNKIKSLKVSQLKKENQIDKQKKYIILISFSLFIAILSVIFFIKINRNSKRRNKLIAIKNSKLKKAQLLTKKSLLEKEILLKEIHHRVKNNMQLIMSLLKIQATDIRNTSVEEFIKISQSRINAMALIHENLYQTKTISSTINFKNYIENLIDIIKLTYEKVKEVKINYEITESTIEIQTAIPLGLIINEIINNSYKHAFNANTNAQIKISFSKYENLYNLQISDNGVGINKNQIEEKGIGLSLIKLLVLQINGKLEIESKLGTTYTIIL